MTLPRVRVARLRRLYRALRSCHHGAVIFYSPFLDELDCYEVPLAPVDGILCAGQRIFAPQVTTRSVLPQSPAVKLPFL